MARQLKNAKRASRPNPRTDRNVHYLNPMTPSSDESKTKRVKLIPRNVSQEAYIDMLENESNHIVFASGPAGTGKTLLATLYAIQQLQLGNIKKIIITRPIVSVDEQLGFLPGDLTQKLAPWCIPVLDVFKEHYSVAAVERLIKDEILEMGALGMMRGRTIKDSICIFDEAQNATVNQMKMMLTRIGDGTRMFVTGDRNQHDRGYSENGLSDFIEKVKARNSKSIAFASFSKKDVERHPIVEEVLDIYGEL